MTRTKVVTLGSTEIITLDSEVERMRASSIAAHAYAEQCGKRRSRDQQRMALATMRLNGIVSLCAELGRQLALIERLALDIADVLDELT